MVPHCPAGRASALPACLLLAATLGGCLDADLLIGRRPLPGCGADGGRCSEPRPRLSVDPPRLLLGDVPRGGYKAAAVRLANEGDAPLTVSALLLDDDAAGQLALLAAVPLPLVLDPARDGYPVPEGVVAVGIAARPEQIGPIQGTLMVRTDDPAQDWLPVPIEGRATGVCLALEPGPLEYGEVAIGTAEEREVELKSCGNLALEVTEVLLLELEGGTPQHGDGFTIARAPAGLLCDAPQRACSGGLLLAEGAVARLSLRYAPQAAEVSFASLVARSREPQQHVAELQVSGRGSDNRCPLAALQVSLPADGGWSPVEVEPGATLHVRPGTSLLLDGSASRDPDGTIAAYRWLLREAPGLSMARFEPDAGAARVTVPLDLAGRYKVELSVQDDRGTPACHSALLQVDARPVDGLHVELIWTTPGDRDRWDTGRGSGTDLDLHLRHPLGGWFAMGDCYFASPHPDWGRLLDEGDDPMLAADDTDGWGPEVIRLTQPEAGSYTVGIHAFEDWGYGSSLVTVRIFVDGLLGCELGDRRMATGEFWEVAAVTWPGPQLTTIDRFVEPAGSGEK